MTEKAVFELARREFADWFIHDGSGRHVDFADGMNTQPTLEDYTSRADLVTDAGPSALTNIHVVAANAHTIETEYRDKLIKARDLLLDVAGIPGPNGEKGLPSRLHSGFESVMKVRASSVTRAR